MKRTTKAYFKRFRVGLTSTHFIVKGPLGISLYPIGHIASRFNVRSNRKDFGWFNYSPSFLRWLSFAHRSVSVGYYLEMALNGVAFKCEYMDFSHAIYLDLGYSHHICFLLPEHAKILVGKRKFTLFSYDHEWLTDTACRLKELRWPDPYRGKGVIYKNEKIKLRPGKQRQ